MRIVGVAGEQAVLALDRFRRADEIVARQRCGNYAVHRGGADLVALVPGAIDQKLQRARGLAAGDAESGDELLLGEAEQLAGGRCCAIGAGGGGGVKAARIMRGRVERVAEPAADFIARNDRGQHVAPGGADHLADGEGGRNHGRARMQRGIGVGVVEVEGMAECAVEQRRDRRRPGLAVAEHRGVALGVERQRLQHLQDRGGRFRFAAGPDRAAEEVQRQQFCPIQHFRRNIPVFQAGDIGGERCGFVGHRVSSFWRAS
ncbi:hypothetical protein ACVWW7_003910 [Bradyrhizobium sp. LM6.9]